MFTIFTSWSLFFFSCFVLSLQVFCFFLVLESITLKTSSVAVSCLTVFWLFMSFAFTLVYKNNLIAMLTIPNVPIPFDNVEEFINQNEMKVLSQAASVITQEIAVSYLLSRSFIFLTGLSRSEILTCRKASGERVWRER